MKEGLAKRSERIGSEIEASEAARAAAETDAAQIRQALGDIESERARMLADADAQAEAILADGRTRISQELAISRPVPTPRSPPWGVV